VECREAWSATSILSSQPEEPPVLASDLVIGLPIVRRVVTLVDLRDRVLGR
jgi:hypothetical protein